jgi:AraC family transcriptional activator FtrA
VQRQFVERPVPAAAEQPLTATLAWAQARLDRPLPVAELARHAHLSVTTLHRRFRTELGTTPLGWLTGERVELARRLLEQGTGLDAVAHRSGLGTTANLRALLRRHTGLSPSEYRARFVAPSRVRPELTRDEEDGVLVQPSSLSTQHQRQASSGSALTITGWPTVR